MAESNAAATVQTDGSRRPLSSSCSIGHRRRDGTLERSSGPRMVHQCRTMHLPTVSGASFRAAGPAVRSVLLAGLISGCVDDAALPSQALPHRFDPGAATSPAIPADLNGDGIAE